MAQKNKLSEADTLDTKSFEDPVLYQDAEGKSAKLGTLEAPDNSKKNKETIRGAAGQEAADGDMAGPANEDVFAELFDGEGLSETFKSKIKGIFEAELSNRTQKITEQLAAEMQEELETKLVEMNETMSTKVDEYLNYVVENWMEENKISVETGMRLQIAESFIENLKGLFENHYISIPDSKVNLLDDLFEKNESVKAKLDEALDVNSTLLSELESYRKNDIANTISEGMTQLDKEKFYSLSEEVSYEDDKTYSDKLLGIKESYFKKKATPAPLVEEVTNHEPQKVVTEGTDIMSGYLRAIERNNRQKG